MNKIENQIQELYDMIQQGITDTLEERKTNEFSSLTRIQNTSNGDIVEVENEVGAVEEMVDKDLVDIQNAPTKLRELDCLTNYWGGKMYKVPYDFVPPKSNLCRIYGYHGILLTLQKR